MYGRESFCNLFGQLCWTVCFRSTHVRKHEQHNVFFVACHKQPNERRTSRCSRYLIVGYVQKRKARADGDEVLLPGLVVFWNVVDGQVCVRVLLVSPAHHLCSKSVGCTLHDLYMDGSRDIKRWEVKMVDWLMTLIGKCFAARGATVVVAIVI